MVTTTGQMRAIESLSPSNKNRKSSWKNSELDSSLPFQGEIILILPHIPKHREIHEDRTKYWTISSKSIVPSPFASCRVEV